MAGNAAVKEARLKAGLSQSDLAWKVEVSRQTINAIENGDYNPTIRLGIRICKALGMTLNDLFWEQA